MADGGDSQPNALARFFQWLGGGQSNEAEQARKEAEQARKEAERARAEAEEMSNYLQQKAEEYSDIMQQCAAGDLTQRMESDGENESMDRIAVEFNQMLGEIEKTTGQLKSYVDKVDSAGSNVERSAETVRTASTDVVDSIQTISADAEDQKTQLRTISETIDEVAASLEQYAANNPDVDLDSEITRLDEKANELRAAADVTEEIQHETNTVSAAAEEQAAELTEMSGRATDLQRYAQPLRDILDRFDTESEHEFVFSGGPSPGATASQEGDDD